VLRSGQNQLGAYVLLNVPERTASLSRACCSLVTRHHESGDEGPSLLGKQGSVTSGDTDNRTTTGRGWTRDGDKRESHSAVFCSALVGELFSRPVVKVFSRWWENVRS